MELDNVWVQLPLGLPTMRGPDQPVDAQYMMALGAVVRAAAQLESQLRDLYCGLTDDKYSAVKAGGELGSNLIKLCVGAALDRGVFDDGSFCSLRALLARAVEAFGHRNRYVHDVWGGSTSETFLFRSYRKTHNVTFDKVDIESVIYWARELNTLTGQVHSWMFETLGATAFLREAQLRWEEEVQRLLEEEAATGVTPPVLAQLRTTHPEGS